MAGGSPSRTAWRTVEFRVGERAHITVDGDVCRSCTTKACVTACPANLFVPTVGRRDPLQLRAVLRVRHLLPGLQRGGCDQLDLPRRRPGRRVPPWLKPGVGPATPRPATPRRPAPLVVACLAPADPRPDVDPLTGEVRVDPAGLGPDGRGRRRPRARPAGRRRLGRAAGGGGRGTGERRRRPAAGRGPRRIGLAGALGARRRPRPGHDGPGRDYRMAAGPRPDRHGPARAGPTRSTDRPWPATRWGWPAGWPPCSSRLGPPDLVVCGDRSALGGTGALPALLAHHLGAAQALGLVSLAVEGEGGRGRP